MRVPSALTKFRLQVNCNLLQCLQLLHNSRSVSTIEQRLLCFLVIELVAANHDLSGMFLAVLASDSRPNTLCVLLIHWACRLAESLDWTFWFAESLVFLYVQIDAFEFAEDQIVVLLGAVV